MLAHQAPEKPPVYVTNADLEQLIEIAETLRSTGALLLARELERAVVVDDHETPHPFVRLDSRVEYRDLITGRTRAVVVVRPGEGDIDRDRLSVLSPVGAALFGLRAGDSFAFCSEDGRPRVLEVLEVSEPAPAPGDRSGGR